jgi:GAF domain-containing protein
MAQGEGSGRGVQTGQKEGAGEKGIWTEEQGEINMTKKHDYFKTFCKVSRAFGTTLEEDEILKLITESAIDTMGGKAACLWLADEEKNEFVPVAHKGLSEKYFAEPIHYDKIAAIVRKEGHLHIYDATTDERVEYHETKKAEGIATMLVVPVRVKGKLIGALTLYTSEPRDFSEDEIQFLTAMAEQGGMAIENARLVEQIRANTKLFHGLSSSINSTLDVKEIIHIMTNDIARALGVKGASVRLLDEEQKTLQLVSSYGLSEKFLKKGPISAKKSIAQALAGKPVIVKNVATDDRIQYKEAMAAEGILSMLCIPLKAKGDVLGVLRLYSGIEREFTKDEVMLVSALAHHGALAIQNASLYLMLKEDMKELKDDIWSHRSWF